MGLASSRGLSRVGAHQAVQVPQPHKAACQGYRWDMNPGVLGEGVCPAAGRSPGQEAPGVPEGQLHFRGYAGCRWWEPRVKELTGHGSQRDRQLPGHENPVTGTGGDRGVPGALPQSGASQRQEAPRRSWGGKGHQLRGTLEDQREAGTWGFQALSQKIVLGTSVYSEV